MGLANEKGKKRKVKEREKRAIKAIKGRGG